MDALDPHDAVPIILAAADKIAAERVKQEHEISERLRKNALASTKIDIAKVKDPLLRVILKEVISHSLDSWFPIINPYVLSLGVRDAIHAARKEDKP